MMSHNISFKNLNRKTKRRVMILGILVASVIWLCFVLHISGAVISSVYDFSVDNNGLIYVGTNNGIYVYQDGQHINTLSPRTSRNYHFIITDQNTILIAQSREKTIELDLYGQLLQEKDGFCKEVGAQRHNTIVANNDTYEMSSILGFSKIVKNGTETVWEIDLFSFLISILRVMGILSLIVFCAWVTFLFKKQGRTGDEVGQGDCDI